MYGKQQRNWKEVLMAGLKILFCNLKNWGKNPSMTGLLTKTQTVCLLNAS
jgi:hypothetical protein